MSRNHLLTHFNWKYIFTEVSLIVISIVLAISITSWANQKRLDKRKRVALKNISRELEENAKELEDEGQTIEEREEMIDFFASLYPYIDIEKFTVKGTLDEMNELRTNFPEMITVTDSTLEENGRYDFDVALEVNFGLVELYDLAWETTKTANIMDQFSFECSKKIIKIYNSQQMFLEEQKKLTDLIVKFDLREMALELQVINEFQKDLEENYENIQAIAENCQ